MIEVLVVIAIIAILLGLVLAAVPLVRESAHRAECLHKLRELALMVHQYHGDHKIMPPYASGRNEEIYGGWFIYLLPYAGYQSMYDDIKAQSGTITIDGVAMIAPAVSMNGVRDFAFPNLLCASDPSAGPPFDRGKTNYLANWYAWGDGSRGPYVPAQRFNDLTDGLSNIVLFGEGYSQCDSLTRVALISSHYHNFGITQDGKPSDDPSYLPDDYTLFQVRPVKCDKWRAQSPHVIMHVALADGSIRCVAPDISQATWTNALKPRDGAALGNDW